MVFLRVQRTAGQDLICCITHGLDINNNSPSKRKLFFSRLYENLKWAEGHYGHKRSIVCGDFNASPHDDIVGGAEGLHAINMVSVGGKTARTVLKKEYDFFYNPMWGMYGSESKGPKAIYYFYGYEEHEMFWHMLDQVVVRPDALDLFDEKRLRILTDAGGISLLSSSGTPDDKHASDHLPILFEMRI